VGCCPLVLGSGLRPNRQQRGLVAVGVAEDHDGILRMQPLEFLCPLGDGSQLPLVFLRLLADRPDQVDD